MSADDAADPSETTATRNGDRVLTVSDLRVGYGRVQALRGIDCHLNAGEIISVIGPNGAGKTSLAEAIAGFVPYTGSVRFRGDEVGERSSNDLVGDGLVLCTESRDLFPFMSVSDNLDLGAYRHPEGADERLEFVYDLFPRLEERRSQDARTMSGGEQQMLAIGRALMSDPDLLILDEPTLGLAPIILDDISDGLDEIQARGVSILLCEQNVTFAMRHADRIYLLENGEVRQEGTPETMRGDDYIQEVYLGG